MLNNTNIALGLVLGSGIELDKSMILEKRVLSEDYAGIHRKQIFECKIADKVVLVFKGRKHYYEGYTDSELTGNVRFAYEKGVRNLLLTNAAGGVNENFSAGDLMLITSHINFIGRLKFRKKPLIVNNKLNELILESAKKANVNITEGVYGCYPGPLYETKAEIEFQKKIPIDAAGMSTIPEIYEALNLGMNVAAISIIANLLKETPAEKTLHEDVIRIAETASASLNLLLPEVISQLN